ncbi:hypothetical protein [Methanobrevibacter sp.]|uniref:hypothetical protein n=1 Tax=Methanobrevibacter sp. TaxID=66852 RepID=UPI0038905922
MKKSCESEFFKWREANINEGRIQGRIEGKIEIIKELLKSMTPKEIAEKTNISLTEIQKIAEQ